MNNLKITLKQPTGSNNYYKYNYIYNAPINIQRCEVQNTINEAKENLGDCYEWEIMNYLVRKLGGSYTSPPKFISDIECII